jgi:hypothetical protein
MSKALKDLIKTEFNIRARRIRAWAMPDGMGESEYRLTPHFD